jgi:hypothetical protein
MATKYLKLDDLEQQKHTTSQEYRLQSQNQDVSKTTLPLKPEQEGTSLASSSFL